MNTTTDYFALQELEVRKKREREREEARQAAARQRAEAGLPAVCPRCGFDLTHDADRSDRPVHDTRAR